MTPEEGEMRLDGSTPSGGGGIHLETTSFTSLATGEANKNSLSVNNGTSNGGANNNNNTRHHTTLAVISLDTPVATDEEGEDGKMGGKSNGGSPNINGLKVTK